MTIGELSTEFDLLYNNISSNKAPGLTEYEKSVFLTQAQERLILEFYSGDRVNIGADTTEEVREYLSNFIEKKVLQEDTTNTNIIGEKAYKLPSDLWFVLQEYVTQIKKDCDSATIKYVVPTTFDDFVKRSRSPFSGVDTQVLRLAEKNSHFLHTKIKYKDYVITYIRKPKPIILEDLSDYNLSIDGITTISEPEIASQLHRQLLLTAVQIAKSVWQ